MLRSYLRRTLEEQVVSRHKETLAHCNGDEVELSRA